MHHKYYLELLYEIWISITELFHHILSMKVYSGILLLTSQKVLNILPYDPLQKRCIVLSILLLGWIDFF